MIGINLRIRHYYSGVDNKEFFTLQQGGSLVPNTSYTANKVKMQISSIFYGVHVAICSGKFYKCTLEKCCL